MRQRQIRHSSHLADLIQGSGLVGSFDRPRPTSASASLASRPKTASGRGRDQEARERRRKGREENEGARSIDQPLTKWRQRPKSAPLSRRPPTRSGPAERNVATRESERVGAGHSEAPSPNPLVLTERSNVEECEAAKPPFARTKDLAPSSPPRRPASAQGLAPPRSRPSSASTVHEIPSRPSSAQGLRSKEAWKEVDIASSSRDFLDARPTTTNRPASAMSASSDRLSVTALSFGMSETPTASGGLGDDLGNLGHVEGERKRGSGTGASTSTRSGLPPKQRYEKLRLLTKIIKRLEQEIEETEDKVDKKIDVLSKEHATALHKLETSQKGALALMRNTMVKLEQKCREMETALKQNNKKWIEEIKVVKYDHKLALSALSSDHEAERAHFQRTLIKHKELSDQRARADAEASDHLKLVKRNLEKSEKKQDFLTKELDETLNALHEAQHKVTQMEVDASLKENELLSSKTKLAETEEALASALEGQQRDEPSRTSRSPSPTSPSLRGELARSFTEPFPYHLLGDSHEDQRKQILEQKKHILALEREVKRTRDKVKAIRSQEMARHSVVLSELEERLQHSEKMGLKARISASHVVKRIKDLLEKYYKPGMGAGGKSASTSKKHMEQIQQEMMVIFDKLETLDESALPTLEGLEDPPSTDTSESNLSPSGADTKALGSNPKQPLREDIHKLSDRVTTVGGAPMTEREAVILECTEYSIQSSEEADAISRVAQLEMQALDSKVEADRATKEAFESLQKVQALESELESTRARLKQCEKVLAKKEQEWIPIGKFAEMSQRCEKAEIVCRGLKEETQRQRTALRFAKQERESKEENLRCANTEGFHLHQHVKKLSEEVKSANFQMKHLRDYCDILKQQKQEEVDKQRHEQVKHQNLLQAQMKKISKRCDHLQATEFTLENSVKDLNTQIATHEATELELRDSLHIAGQDLARAASEKSELERKYQKLEKVLQVAEANVKYFKARQQGDTGTATGAMGIADPQDSAQASERKVELSLECVFDIFVGGECERD